MKQTIILNVIIVWLSLIGVNAFAQSSKPSYIIEPVPNWVNAQSYNPDGFTDKAYGNAPYLLYTRQIELGPKTRVSYMSNNGHTFQYAHYLCMLQICAKILNMEGELTSL